MRLRPASLLFLMLFVSAAEAETSRRVFATYSNQDLYAYYQKTTATEKRKALARMLGVQPEELEHHLSHRAEMFPLGRQSMNLPSEEKRSFDQSLFRAR